MRPIVNVPKKTGGFSRPHRYNRRRHRLLFGVTFTDIPGADEEEHEESLIESWTPRFKR